MIDESLTYWIALKAVEGVGCVGYRNLLAAFGTPEAVFRASVSSLQVIPGIGPKTADHIRSFSDWGFAEEEADRCRKRGVSVVTCQDPIYPSNLLNIYDYPPFLYVRGSLLAHEVGVAVVGSRVASTYGKFVTEKLSRELALGGITVISGLARGIDSAAHRGALAGKGRTIAVLGCGLDVLYPPENQSLAGDIAAHGAVVTEFPFGTPPNAPNFPARNRIISGIALGVVVVEAGEKSGSLITARIAAEQGRSVFAVPGAVGSAGSRGTNRLIKQGAKLIENAEDILEEILPQAGIPQPCPEQLPLTSAVGVRAAGPDQGPDPLPSQTQALEEREQRLLTLITHEPADVDRLIAASGLAAQEVQAGLLVLELNQIIRRMPGNLFTRKE
ncbi:MAG: DNA-processing protein DprA [Thermodesulfobacteriota bacterium]